MADNYLSKTVVKWDDLIAGSQIDPVTEEITLESGQANRKRGDVLGKKTRALGSATFTGTGNGTMTSVSMGKSTKKGSYKAKCKEVPVTNKTVPTSGTPGGSNTGGGTMTSVAIGNQSVAKPGTYKLTCIGTAGNGGTFKVEDPEEYRLADAVVGTPYVSDHLNFTLNDVGTDFALGDTFTVVVTAVKDSGKFDVFDPDGVHLGEANTGVAFASNHINFTINDGATDFVVNDTFTIPVSDGSGKAILSLAAAVDGSEVPAGVLSEDKDATSEDKKSVMYIRGMFNQNKITLGTGHTVASVKDVMKSQSMLLVSSIKSS